MPIIQRLIVVYKIWHEYLPRLPKIFQHNLGGKIDTLFIEIIENTFVAQHKSKDRKTFYLNKASDKLDLLKFLLQIAWEIKALDDRKYILLSEKLNELGRMLGGWRKQTQTPHKMGS